MSDQPERWELSCPDLRFSVAISARGLKCTDVFGLRREATEELRQWAGENFDSVVGDIRRNFIEHVLNNAPIKKAEPVRKADVTPDPARWIPVEERLPEDGKEVLCTTRVGCVIARRFEGLWRSFWDGGTLQEKPTHWRELPAGPEVG